MRNVKNSVKFLFISVTALFLIASCGGGGNGGATSAAVGAATGTVTLLVTDGPNHDFNAVNLTVTRAELISDSGMVTLFSGKKRFDLLQLANVTEIFSSTEVPAGSYNKIRLTLTEIELELKDGTKAYPKLPGNGKLDLKPSGSFLVTSASPIMIQLDMDAEKSILAVNTGNGSTYQFRPVVFIKIIKDSFDTKLVRLQGTVSKLDSVLNEFDLCLIYAQGFFIDDGSQSNSPYCVQVNTVDNMASFFDVVAEPIRFGNLNNGDVVTVVGRIAFDGIYPTAASRAKSDDDSTDDGSTDDDSSDDDSAPVKMVLAAEVVWLGHYLELNGIARSNVTTDMSRGEWFKYEILSGGGIVSGASIPSILQPGSKLFSPTGISLDSSSIQADVPTIVNGVLDLKTGDLKGVLFILDTEASAKLDQLTGIIGDVKLDFSSMILLTDSGDRCVNISTSDTKVFEASFADNENIDFAQMTAYDLHSGLQANVFGDELNGCLDADTIIYEEGGASITPVQPLP